MTFETVELAAGVELTSLVCALAVAWGDDQVTIAPDDQCGHRRCQVKPVAGEHALTVGPDDCAQRRVERGAGLAIDHPLSSVRAVRSKPDGDVDMATAGERAATVHEWMLESTR